MASLICLVIAFIFAALATTVLPQYPRFHFGWAALAAFVLAFLLGAPALRW